MIWLIATMVISSFLAFASWKVVGFYIRYMQLRTAELDACQDLLCRYEQRIDSVLDDPALPHPMRRLLSTFDRSIGHRLMARRVAFLVFTRRHLDLLDRPPASDIPSDSDMRFLATHRPDLLNGVAEVVTAGFGYTMMKWPFAARVFRLMMVFDAQRDAITPAKTLIESVGDDNFHNGNGLTAAA